MSQREIWLIRHGETAWSLSGQHTGWSDIPLTEEGERQARAVDSLIAGTKFAAVFSSPLQRAKHTCELAGLGGQMELLDDLKEWNYGDMEGLTSAQIQLKIPGWSVWKEGPTGGEKIEDVSVRTQRVLDRVDALDAAPGPVAVFAHGHVLRILTARYLSLTPLQSSLFALSTATLSVLGYEQGRRVMRLWNKS